MTGEPSFAVLLDRIRAKDAEAAGLLLQRFTRRLIALARSQLPPWSQSKLDPEDIVQSVYRSFFVRHGNGAFAFDTWDNLWALLSVMTIRKCVNKADYLRAARRDVRREVDLPPDRDLAEDAIGLREPTPEQAATLSDLVDYLLQGFDERGRAILLLHLEGFTLEEISTRVGRALRTVRRTIERARKRLFRLRAEGEDDG
jgi:RNA polymerase sigma-70 factor (ECF subfamily)